MPKSSKINIFNEMTEEELDYELKNVKNSRREFQRFVAMKGISKGISHKLIAEIVGVSYSSINRWATSCSKKGIEGLLPNFNGGRPSRLTVDQKLKFGNILYLNDEELTMTDAKQILADEFGIEYTLTQVANIVEDLGFVYNSTRPEYLEAPEDKEQILIDRIKEANITEDDILVGVDESTMKTGHKTKKTLKLKCDKKNVKK